MKTLYLTDLDGTLLNERAEISEFTKKQLQMMISDGLLFSVATARTNATVLNMFSGVGLNLPFILMNGVVIYDPTENKNVKAYTIDHKDVYKIISIYEKYNKSPMLYLLRDGYLEILYKSVDNIHQQQYINARDNLKFKRFRKYSGKYIPESTDKIIYMVSLDKEDILTPIHREIVASGSVNCAFYKDNYTDCYFMESMNNSVSKGIAALELKKLLGVDRIVAYGDNLNDIPMFKTADESYAVANACDELKKIATGVIDSNNNDGVVKHILNKFSRGE